MNNIHDEIVKELVNDYDRLIFDCFKRCGIELDLKDLDKWRGRIEAYVVGDATQPVAIEEWYLDGKKLFRIHRYFLPMVVDADGIHCRVEVRHNVEFMEGGE